MQVSMWFSVAGWSCCIASSTKSLKSKLWSHVGLSDGPHTCESILLWLPFLLRVLPLFFIIETRDFLSFLSVANVTCLSKYCSLSSSSGFDDEQPIIRWILIIIVFQFIFDMYFHCYLIWKHIYLLICMWLIPQNIQNLKQKRSQFFFRFCDIKQFNRKPKIS